MTPLPIEIGAAREDEADAIVAIDRASFTHGNAGPLLDVREELARAWSRVWVARKAGKVAGYLVVWHVADELHLLAIATEPAERRSGVGRALMDHLLAHAFEREVRHVFLEVRKSNDAAIALYRRYGFFVLGKRRAYYADGEDALELALALDPVTKTVLQRADEEEP